MPGRKKLILVASEAMASNKKEDRNENNLVRMAATVRKFMGYGDDKVELWSNATDTQKRISSAILLDIFQAFKEDIKRVKAMVESGELDVDDLNRIGFVTPQTYKRVTGEGPEVPVDIWISNRIEDTVIGADPEFLLFDNNGNVIRANGVSGFTSNGQIGYDGPWAEVRPDPAISPVNLVNNIHKILSDKNLTKAIEKYRWIGDCYHVDSVRDYPVGGHIHIGNPIQIAKLSVNDRRRFFIVMNKIIDELLSIPLIRLDGDKGKNRRTKGTYKSYGYFGEYRLCCGRLEHRTLSGLWLAHPVLTRTVFGVAKAIIDEVFNLISQRKFDREFMMLPEDKSDVFRTNFNGWKDIPLAKEMGCIKPSKYMRDILKTSNANTINNSYLKKWHNRMKSLSSYEANREYIEMFLAILKRPVSELNGIDRNLKNNWLEGKRFIID